MSKWPHYLMSCCGILKCACQACKDCKEKAEA